ncbi:MAG: nuclear transport factor 2 family protein [Calditrichaeota bacterium]|nr:nuclear transport factor 2 family protein [Calditrichota bacterium]
MAAWKAFVEATNIHYWKGIDPKIQIYGDGKFAVVTYYFDISFDMGGQTIKMGGRDMLMLVKENGKWWVVADRFSPIPEQQN